MAKRISPTQLTMTFLRKRGIPCAVTERWVKTKQGGFRRDIWGGDLMALVTDGIINIQAGIASHRAAKIAKASGLDEVKLWLSCPSRHFQIWTWRKRPAFNKDGQRRKNMLWSPGVVQLSLRDGVIVAEEFHLNG